MMAQKDAPHLNLIVMRLEMGERGYEFGVK